MLRVKFKTTNKKDYEKATIVFRRDDGIDLHIAGHGPIAGHSQLSRSGRLHRGCLAR